MWKVQDAEQVFAKRLREIRTARKWSQATLATEIGTQQGIKLDATAITRIERGQRRIYLAEARAIAGVLGTSVDAMCETGPAADIRDLRRELAIAEDQFVSLEVSMEMANRAYAEMRAHVEDLRSRLIEATAEEAGDGPR